jgi:hypothetical protein
MQSRIMNSGSLNMKTLRLSNYGRFLAWCGCVTLCAVMAACSSYGPKSMDRDQLDYGRSLGDNWKAQMLINLVKLRYVDMPVFVDVGQIVSGYSLETMVNAGLGLNTAITGADTQSLGASGRFTDRPTITYTPKTGDDYLRSLLEPVEPQALLSLVLAGYSSKLLFAWAVESINGVQNFSITGNKAQSAAPEYTEFIELFQNLQDQGAISFEIESKPGANQDMIVLFRNENLDEATLAKRKRVAEILGLSPDRDRYRIVYAPFAQAEGILAMQTRSMLQMMAALSGFVHVPSEKASHAAPGYQIPAGDKWPFRVYSGPDHPEDKFTTIQYHDYWYWIENDDLQSKKVFTLMLFLTTLTNSGSKENAPVLTIPTG